MGPDFDWQSLERKLAAGMSLERAAELVGVDIEAARKWARETLDQQDAGDITMARTAGVMLERGFSKLSQIASEGRRLAAVEHFDDEGNHTKTERYSDADLDAAKALVTAAIAVRKLLGPARAAKTGRGASATIQLDLWDNRKPDMKGPWKLEDPA